MTILSMASAMVPLGAVRLGPMRFSAYGLCAACGLVAAMAMARQSARRLNLHPEQAWDAGLFALGSCFVASRLLLVIFDLKAFLHYPLLVLSLPSLTYAGMVLAAVALAIYVWRKRLPTRTLLDVFAVPGAVLAVFLEVGNYLSGNEVGMPTRLPWGVPDVLSGPGVRLHPVAVYGVLCSALLAVVLWLRLGTEALPGRVAALGLMMGGVAAFLLDMVTEPMSPLRNAGVEPGQWIALTAMLAGALLWTFAPTTPIASPAVQDAPPHADTVIVEGR